MDFMVIHSSRPVSIVPGWFLCFFFKIPGWSFKVSGGFLVIQGFGLVVHGFCPLVLEPENLEDS